MSRLTRSPSGHPRHGLLCSWRVRQGVCRQHKGFFSKRPEKLHQRPPLSQHGSVLRDMMHAAHRQGMLPAMANPYGITPRVRQGVCRQHKGFSKRPEKLHQRAKSKFLRGKRTYGGSRATPAGDPCCRSVLELLRRAQLTRRCGGVLAYGRQPRGRHEATRSCTRSGQKPAPNRYT